MATHPLSSSNHPDRFRDRAEAGRYLAERLRHLQAERPIVVGLPRGGVPVAFEVAAALQAPLDIIVVRKLGVPFQHELAMGAVGEQGARVLNADVVFASRISDEELRSVELREQTEVVRRAERFRRGRPMLPMAGRTVIVVDDGIATGATARAALQVTRALGAAKVILAVPVAPQDTLQELRAYADDVIAVAVPSQLWAVGSWYQNFSQVPDEEVVHLLDLARHRDLSGGSDGADDAEVLIPVDGVNLSGTLTLVPAASAIVVFAHGSGSSRHSPRNRSVAAQLQQAGLATLLFDLLTPNEESDRRNVFDIELLSERLLAVTAWVRHNAATASMSIGYFGASTGAAAALWAAAEPGNDVFAVVSRGGRPDLAAARLRAVRAPTLLLVGGFDDVVIDLNRGALNELRGERSLQLVPAAGHLFEEPGALEAVADASRRWFLDHLPT